MTHPRPLSPHLSIYRWLITNTLSILHRITGVALCVGTVLLVAWLVTAAYYPAQYLTLQECMGSMLGRLMLVGWTFAFYYHLCNGIRHLFWDMGKGFELGTVNVTGAAVIIATIGLTAFSWVYATQFAYQHADLMGHHMQHSPENIHAMPDEDMPIDSRPMELEMPPSNYDRNVIQ